jgi:hypothetical protein
MAQSTGPRPDQATRDAVTERIFAHARENWPRIEVFVRHRGAFCYAAVLEPSRTRRRRLFTIKPGEREPFPGAPPALPGQRRPLAHRDLQGQQRKLERERTAHPLRPRHRHPADHRRPVLPRMDPVVA